MDKLTREQRGLLMSRVRSKNTKPELLVRSLIFALGFRYRLHRKDLPGSPDIAFIARKKVIFVNGCFWHGHNCKGKNIPKSSTEFWENKINLNRERDKKNYGLLTSSGWSYMMILECEIKNQALLKEKLIDYLS